MGEVKPKEFMKKWFKWYPIVKDAETVEEIMDNMTQCENFYTDIKDLNNEWKMYQVDKKLFKLKSKQNNNNNTTIETDMILNSIKYKQQR